MSLPLHAQLIQMGTAGWITNILYAAAELGLADHLETPKTATEIASGLDADPRSLHRLMRTLASLGILSQGPDDRFSLTPLGVSLKSDAPGSARSTLRTFGGPAFTRGFENIVYSVKTGKTGFEKAQLLGALQSQIPNWQEYHLDTDPDGTAYKPDSLYMEATKP